MERAARLLVALVASLLLVLVAPGSIGSAPLYEADWITCGGDVYTTDPVNELRSSTGVGNLSLAIHPEPACDWGVEPPYEGPSYEDEQSAAATDPPPPPPVPVSLPTWRNLYDWPSGHGYAGWHSASSRTGAYGIEQSLGGNAGLWLWPAGEQDYTASDFAEWTYTAPGTTRISTVSLNFAYRNKLLAHHCLAIGLRTGTAVVSQHEWCTPAKPPDSQRDVAVLLADPASSPDAKTLFIRIRVDCKDASTCSKHIPALDPLQTAGTARLKFVEMTLVDDDQPTVSAGGPLYDARSQYVAGTGTTTAALAASDPGSGVSRLWLDTDGVPGPKTQAPCDAAHHTDALDARICPQSAGAAAAVDLATLAEGAHWFAAAAEDVAGNVGRSDPWKVSVDRTPPAAASGIGLYFYDPADRIAGVSWSHGADPPLADGTPGSGVSLDEFRYRRDGGAWTAWTESDEGGVDVADSSVGDQIAIEVRSYDGVGNLSTVAEGAVTVTERAYRSLNDAPRNPFALAYDEENPGDPEDTGEDTATGFTALGLLPDFKYSPWTAVDYMIDFVGDRVDVMSPAGYNPDYHHFNRRDANGDWDGNDCQNFVSQALRAAGWTKDYGLYNSDSAWWYRGGGRFNHTKTWAGVANFGRYLDEGNRADLVYAGRNSVTGGVWNAQIGDIVLVNWDTIDHPTLEAHHSMLVTQRTFVRTTSGGLKLVIGLTYHTSNRLHWPLRKLMRDNRNAYWWVWRSHRD